MAWAKARSTRRDHCQLILWAVYPHVQESSARVGRRREALTAALRGASSLCQIYPGPLSSSSSTTLLLTVSFIPKVQPIL